MPISQNFMVRDDSTLSIIDKSPQNDSVNENVFEERQGENWATKNFIRRQLEEKSPLHHFYQDY